MERVIIYGSNYGASKKYAEELGRRMDLAAVSYKELRDVNAYTDIIYVGGLYAGGVCGMSKVLKKWKRDGEKRLCVITVGLADPNISENVENIRKCIRTQLPDELYRLAKFYHLRGGIDYTKLGGMHKMMMKFAYKKCKDIPEEQRGGEMDALVETYGQSVDFLDFTSLDPIVKDFLPGRA